MEYQPNNNSPNNSTNDPVDFERSFGEKNIPSVIGILVIIAVVVIAGGAIYAYEYANKPGDLAVVPTITQTNDQPDQTAGWKTYTNAEYGFEVQYLDAGRTHVTDWIRDDFSNTDAFPPKDGLLTFGQYITANGDGTPGCVDYSVVISSANGKDINNWIEEAKARNDRSFDYQGMGDDKSIRVNGKITSIQDIKVGDVLGKVVLIEGGYPLDTGEFGIIKNNKIYSISYHDDALNNNYKCKNSSKDYQDIFEKMISTFRFTK